MSNPLRFYFDFISPNAYLAWHAVRPIAARYDRAVEAVPVLFAALLTTYEAVGPAEIAPKLRWMVLNCVRKARAAGIAFEPPASHPFNPLAPLRLASLPMEEEDRLRLIDGLFAAVWADGVDVSDDVVLGEWLDANGFSAADMLERSVAPENKQRLRTQTDVAIEAGVFGVPTVIVDDQLFFGYDDLPWLERHLAGEPPLPDDVVTRWEAVRPSAFRR